MVRSPVLMIVFNRPDTTQQVFQAIRRARPSRLYVAADGPRTDRPGEAEKVKEVRDHILANVDWPCELKTLFREQNVGCNAGVTSAITWFFEHETEGIILEDDCLAVPSFFGYCDEVLERHRHDERIMCVSGDNFISSLWKPDSSYYFTRVVHIWGWATWKRAWEKNPTDFRRAWDASGHKFPVGTLLRKYSVRHYWMEKFRAVLENRKISWDFNWLFAIWLNGGISCAPKVNLISNIGFGPEATLSVNPEDKLSKLPHEDIELPLVHPKSVTIADQADQWEQFNVYDIRHPWSPSVIIEDLGTFSARHIRNIRGRLGRRKGRQVD